MTDIDTEKETKRVTTRYTHALLERLAKYCAKHGLSRDEVVRLAVIQQLKTDPPARLPKGVKRTRGNPKIGEQSARGNAAKQAKAKKTKS